MGIRCGSTLSISHPARLTQATVMTAPEENRRRIASASVSFALLCLFSCSSWQRSRQSPRSSQKIKTVRGILAVSSGPTEATASEPSPLTYIDIDHARQRDKKRLKDCRPCDFQYFRQFLFLFHPSVFPAFAGYRVSFHPCHSFSFHVLLVSSFFENNCIIHLSTNPIAQFKASA